MNRLASINYIPFRQRWKKNLLFKSCLVVGLIVAGAIYLYTQNNFIVTTHYNVSLETSLGGIKILQIADLQNKTFGKEQEKLLKAIKKLDPDIIVFTGDLFDRRRTDDHQYSFDLVDGLAKDKYPMYYVSGNHECWLDDYSDIIQGLKSRGVHVLDNDYAILNIKGTEFALLGVIDPSFYYNEKMRKYRSYYGIVKSNDELRRLMNETEGYQQILLSHRPELHDLYEEEGVPLVLSGHAHGGQFRIPGVGGVYAPAQGFFPEYDGGLYRFSDTQMVLSRGLGNSSFPFRVNNRPELTLITIK